MLTKSQFLFFFVAFVIGVFLLCVLIIFIQGISILGQAKSFLSSSTNNVDLKENDLIHDTSAAAGNLREPRDNNSTTIRDGNISQEEQQERVTLWTIDQEHGPGIDGHRVSRSVTAAAAAAAADADDLEKPRKRNNSKIGTGTTGSSGGGGGHVYNIYYHAPTIPLSPPPYDTKDNTFSPQHQPLYPLFDDDMKRLLDEYNGESDAEEEEAAAAAAAASADTTTQPVILNTNLAAATTNQTTAATSIPVAISQTTHVLNPTAPPIEDVYIEDDYL